MASRKMKSYCRPFRPEEYSNAVLSYGAVSAHAQTKREHNHSFVNIAVYDIRSFHPLSYFCLNGFPFYQPIDFSEIESYGMPPLDKRELTAGDHMI